MDQLAPTIYPAAINRALAQLDESTVFFDVPCGFLRVLFRIVKKINIQKPTSPICASRRTLAEECGKGIETIHRAIRWLEDNDLIQREQRAQPGLKGSSSPIVPTQRLLKALLLSEPCAVTSSRKRKRTESHVDTPPSSQQFRRVANCTLPSDLVWLTQKGLTAPAVLLLMRIAKSSGHQLSAIVESSRSYLAALAGNRLFAYLKKLATSQVDFGRRLDEETAKHEEKQHKELVARKSDELVGRRFRGLSGGVTITVGADGWLHREEGNLRSVMPMCKRFLDAIDAGRLRQIR